MQWIERRDISATYKKKRIRQQPMEGIGRSIATGSKRGSIRQKEEEEARSNYRRGRGSNRQNKEEEAPTNRKSGRSSNRGSHRHKKEEEAATRQKEEEEKEGGRDNNQQKEEEVKEAKL